MQRCVAKLSGRGQECLAAISIIKPENKHKNKQPATATATKSTRLPDQRIMKIQDHHGDLIFRIISIITRRASLEQHDLHNLQNNFHHHPGVASRGAGRMQSRLTEKDYALASKHGSYEIHDATQTFNRVSTCESASKDSDLTPWFAPASDHSLVAASSPTKLCHAPHLSETGRVQEPNDVHEIAIDAEVSHCKPTAVAAVKVAKGAEAVMEVLHVSNNVLC